MGQKSYVVRKFQHVFVRYLRDKWMHRILPYIDDFFIAPSPPVHAPTESDAAIARMRITRLLTCLGLALKVGKAYWEGARQIDHLSMHIDTVAMKL